MFTNKKSTFYNSIILGFCAVTMLSYQNCAKAKFSSPERTIVTNCSENVHLAMTAPLTGNIGDNLVFSVSSDNATIDSANWEMGDASTMVGVSGDHSYSAAGTYNVSVVANVTYNSELCAVSPESKSVVILNSNGSCPNGATNPPACNVCPAGQTYDGTSCVTPPTACTNGATNPPACNVCPAGQTYDGTSCVTPPTACTNGATNPPTCNVCPAGQTYDGTSCVTPTSCGSCPANPEGGAYTKTGCNGATPVCTLSCNSNYTLSANTCTPKPPVYSCTAHFTAPASTSSAEPLSNINGGCSHVHCTVTSYFPGTVQACAVDASGFSPAPPPQCRPNLLTDPNWSGPVGNGPYIYTYDADFTDVQDGVVHEENYVIDPKGSSSNHMIFVVTPVYEQNGVPTNFSGAVACP